MGAIRRRCSLLTRRLSARTFSISPTTGAKLRPIEDWDTTFWSFLFPPLTRLPRETVRKGSEEPAVYPCGAHNGALRPICPPRSTLRVLLVPLFRTGSDQGFCEVELATPARVRTVLPLPASGLRSARRGSALWPSPCPCAQS